MNERGGLDGQPRAQRAGHREARHAHDPGHRPRARPTPG